MIVTEEISFSKRGFRDMCIPRITAYHLCHINIHGGKRELSRSPTFSLRLSLDEEPSTVFKNLTENKTIICSLLSRHFYYYSCVADEAGYLASVFIVSLPGDTHITSDMCTGIHISL